MTGDATTGRQEATEGPFGMSRFLDVFVVYKSEHEDGQFVAHSVKTDQIGMGGTVDEALYELFAALAVLVEEAKDHPGEVVIWQPAPPDIINKMLTAERLPDAILNRVRSRFRARLSTEWVRDDDDDMALDDGEAQDDQMDGSSMMGVVLQEELVAC